MAVNEGVQSLSPVRPSILSSAGSPGAKRVAETFLKLVVDLGHDGLSDAVLDVAGVAKDAFALSSNSVSDLGCDLIANGLTAGTEIVLDNALPDRGCDAVSALVGGVEDLIDEVVDASLNHGGDHCAAQVCEQGDIRGYLVNSRHTLMMNGGGLQVLVDVDVDRGCGGWFVV